MAYGPGDRMGRMRICSIGIVAALSAVLQSAPLEAALGHPRAQRFRYSVVSAGGRALTVTIAPNAVEVLVPGKAPSSTVSGGTGLRQLGAHWTAAGIYPATQMVSDAPELRNVPGPWGISLDFD
jgi:hypothetical protein